MGEALRQCWSGTGAKAAVELFVGRSAAWDHNDGTAAGVSIADGEMTVAGIVVARGIGMGLASEGE